jgi:phosphate transport system protein
MGPHTDSTFDADLRSLKARVLAMGHLVEKRVGQALCALIERDVALAGTVIDGDRAVNRMGARDR